MPHGVQSGLGFVKLDDISAAAYGCSVEYGRFERRKLAEKLSLSPEETDRVEEVLRRLQLLQPMPGNPDVLVPVVPDVAATELVGSAERQIQDLQRAVSSIRGQLTALTPVFYEGHKRRLMSETLDVIHDASRIEPIADHLTQGCHSELLVVQPGGAHSAETLATARNAGEATLARGVRVRALYQQTARNDSTTRAFLRKAVSLGAEVRVADRLVDRLVIYDREVAFLPDRALPGEPADRCAAAVVREPTVVSYLCTVFEHLWEGAAPFAEGQDTPAVTDDLKQSIILLMAEGYKDEMVARRLGMSVRTCRRHIAEITESLKAKSRFQAGFNMAMLELFDTFTSML